MDGRTGHPSHSPGTSNRLSLCVRRRILLFLFHPFLRKAMISSSPANLGVHGSGGYARVGDVELQPQAVSLSATACSVVRTARVVPLFREEMPRIPAPGR